MKAKKKTIKKDLKVDRECINVQRRFFHFYSFFNSKNL